MIWPFRSNVERPCLKRRLIRNVAPESVNDTIRELEDEGYTIVNVIARSVVYQTRGDTRSAAIYDLLVSGENDPLWGSWGIHG